MIHLRRTLALLIALAMLFVCPSLAEGTLPEPENAARDMFLGEAAEEYPYEATLYFVASDGLSLTQTSRTLWVRSGETLLEVVLRALLSASGSSAQLSVAPSDTRVISSDLACSLATVNLSIDARNVQSEQELLMTYLAIAATLLEIEGIEAVNVLINDRQEGLLQLPCGAYTAVAEDAAAAWAQAQAEAERYLGASQGAITRTAALYFPSADGLRLTPETREITFARNGGVEALLQELCAGPQRLSCAQALSPSGETLVSGEPVLTVTDAGERILEINLRGAALDAAVSAGVGIWQVCGALTMTLCSFLPELDGVRLSIEGEPLDETWRNGEALSFSNGVMRRRDFNAFLGSAVQMYFADAEGNLVRREIALSPGAALSPRALLEALLSTQTAEALGAFAPVPTQLSATDILGVRVKDAVAEVNLSARFYAACQGLNETQERTAAYAIVNTLCGLTGINGVRFLFEGESVETLAESIYLRSVLLPNPGAAVTG